MPAITSTEPDGTLCLAGSLRIYDLEPAMRMLLDHLQSHAELRLDLDALTECDAGGFQLLLAIRGAALGAGKGFHLRATGPALARSCATALGAAPEPLLSLPPAA